MKLKELDLKIGEEARKRIEEECKKEIEAQKRIELDLKKEEEKRKTEKETRKRIEEERKKEEEKRKTEEETRKRIEEERKFKALNSVVELDLDDNIATKINEEVINEDPIVIAILISNVSPESKKKQLGRRLNSK